ncbi:MAG: DHH family phosphoesterase [Nanoarchaeota archaeon]
MAWNDFLIGKEEDFYEFVEKIKPDDKIGIITHTDLDGIASVVFLEKILESKSIKVKRIKFLDFKKDMFDESCNFFKSEGINKIFFTDMNADNSDFEGFEKLRKNFKIFLIDHHPANLNLKWNKNVLKSKSTDCSAWVLYNLAKKYLDVSEFDELVCATMISEWSFNDSENMKFLEEKYPKIGKNIDGSESKKLSDKIGASIIYFKDMRKVYSLIKKKSFGEMDEAYEKIEHEIQKSIKKYNNEAKFYPEKNLHFAYFNSKYNFSSFLMTIISKQDYNKTYILSSDRDNRILKINSRNQSGNVDLDLLMKKGIEGLKNATAGGHRKAAGATIMKEDLNKFIENILK